MVITANFETTGSGFNNRRLKSKAGQASCKAWGKVTEGQMCSEAIASNRN